MSSKNIKALALYSGGLDSILAARVVMKQGIEVEAVQFVTPFFNYEILQDIEAYKEQVLRQFGITVYVEDLSERYLDMLHQPEHGFGKNFNPCIDCKIMMMRRAKALMAEKNAAFLISGEVLGQRPMSQRRDTFNVISRDSETRDILLRPLSARLMPETEAERNGWVDRNALYKMSGRGRSAQIALAKEFGIEGYPAPAGGCILADPILSRRIKALYTGDTQLRDSAQICSADIHSLLIGRQLRLPEPEEGGGWLILGRDEGENDRLALLAGEDDALLFMEEWPGPSALLKKAAQYRDADILARNLALAASLIVRYGKKIPPQDCRRSRQVFCEFAGEKSVFEAEAFVGDEYRQWVVQ